MLGKLELKESYVRLRLGVKALQPARTVKLFKHVKRADGTFAQVDFRRLGFLRVQSGAAAGVGEIPWTPRHGDRVEILAEQKVLEVLDELAPDRRQLDEQLLRRRRVWGAEEQKVGHGERHARRGGQRDRDELCEGVLDRLGDVGGDFGTLVCLERRRAEEARAQVPLDERDGARLRALLVPVLARPLRLLQRGRRRGAEEGCRLVTSGVEGRGGAGAHACSEGTDDRGDGGQHALLYLRLHLDLLKAAHVDFVVQHKRKEVLDVACPVLQKVPEKPEHVVRTVVKMGPEVVHVGAAQRPLGGLCLFAAVRDAEDPRKLAEVGVEPVVQDFLDGHLSEELELVHRPVDSDDGLPDARKQLAERVWLCDGDDVNGVFLDGDKDPVRDGQCVFLLRVTELDPEHD